MTDFWKTLRVLTADQCNYNCAYCHNEGQKTSTAGKTLSYDKYVMFMQAVEPLSFNEIFFTGGEPLLNPATIDMIEWTDKNVDCDVRLATNGNHFTDEIAQRLARTNVMVRFHYPSSKDDSYRDITGSPIENFKNAVRLSDRYGIQHSFNFVLHPDVMECLDGVIDDVVSSRKQIYLFPFTEPGFNNISAGIIRRVTDILDSLSASKNFNAEQQTTTWTFGNGGQVRLDHSPCYEGSIDLCRSRGVLRLTPDFSLAKCLYDKAPVSLKGMEAEEIRKTVNDQWISLDSCPASRR